jgi:TolB-like protein
VPSNSDRDIAFGPFRFDPRGRRLTRDGTPVPVGGRALDVFAVLAILGDTVSKDVLLDKVWSGAVVEENNLQVQISALRRALGDGWVVTVPGRGYRLTIPPDAVRASIGGPIGPAIAVLPFANLSDDPGQEYFADGMVEEIITALSRIRWLPVISRNSGLTYKGQFLDVKEIGRELGVRYILEGSVRRAGDQLRITARLTETQGGSHLWADRFNVPLADVFDIQDRVASSIAGVIEPTLQVAETTRAARHVARDFTAYDLYLQAYAIALSPAARFPQALHLLEQAIAIDHDYGPALALAAFCYFRLAVDNGSSDPTADAGKAVNLARRALDLAGDDPAILANAAYTLAYFGEDISAMMALIDRALALNPSFARGWHISGILRLWSGQPDIAIEHANAALRLSPRVRVGWAFLTIGAAHFVSRRFEEALPKLLVAVQDDPGFPTVYRFLAACYAHLGRLPEAHKIVARLRAITPVVLPSATFMRNVEHRELWLSGLRLAIGEPSKQHPFSEATTALTGSQGRQPPAHGS